MSKVITATVLTNSLVDSLHRVRISSPGYWVQSDLVQQNHDVPLNKGDLVYVDVTDGVAEPVILGKVNHTEYQTSASVAGHQVWESHSEGGWSAATVNGPVVKMENSEGAYMEFSNEQIYLNGSQYSVVRFQKLQTLISNMISALSTMTVVVEGGLTGSISPTSATALANLTDAIQGLESPNVKVG